MKTCKNLNNLLDYLPLCINTWSNLFGILVTTVQRKKNEVIKENAFRNSTHADYSIHTRIIKSKGKKINLKLNQKMLLKIRSSSQYSTSWCPGNILAPNICNTLPNENTAKKLFREQTMRKTRTQSFQCTTRLHNIPYTLPQYKRASL